MHRELLYQNTATSCVFHIHRQTRRTPEKERGGTFLLFLLHSAYCSAALVHESDKLLKLHLACFLTLAPQYGFYKGLGQLARFIHSSDIVMNYYGFVLFVVNRLQLSRYSLS